MTERIAPSIGRRIVARVVDYAVVSAAGAGIGAAIGFGFAWLAITAALVLAYFVVGDALAGKTIGKGGSAAMGVRSSATATRIGCACRALQCGGTRYERARVAVGRAVARRRSAGSHPSARAVDERRAFAHCKRRRVQRNRDHALSSAMRSAQGARRLHSRTSWQSPSSLQRAACGTSPVAFSEQTGETATQSA